MVEGDVTRRLAAILAADVASYTRLVEEDTTATVMAWQEARDNFIDPGIAKHSGRVVKLTGDGFLAEFPTVQAAVECAIEMQEGLKPGPLEFRMGVSMGDIIDDGRDVHGEGVNIAARLEALSDSGGICISGDVYHQVRNRIDEIFEDWGEQEVKHVSQPVRVYAIQRFVTNRRDRASHAPKGRHVKWGAAIVAGAAVLAAVTVFTQLPSDKDNATPPGPRLAVIPFKNISGTASEDFFSDGLTKDINAQLSRFSNLFVIAPNSVSGFRDNATCENIRSELQADYILEGSVRRSDNDLRVTTTFTDAKSCRQVRVSGSI
jgi:class 3 adenylate cyclase/TolB-like protein